jgi:hypothetical protein
LKIYIHIPATMGTAWTPIAIYWTRPVTCICLCPHPRSSLGPLARESTCIIFYIHFIYKKNFGYILIHRVPKEERTIFWEVIVSVILSKKLYTNMCPIPNGFRGRVILVVWLGRQVLPSPPRPVAGRKVNILGGHSIGHSKQKTL